MSNSAWFELNSISDILKLHDLCNNPKYKCQKQNTFTPKQFQMEGRSITNKLKSIFRGTQAVLNKFLKPAVNMAAPFIGMAAGAKSKNPQVGQATTDFLKNISGCKILF